MHEFCNPRFSGPRFAEHTLPVSVARDLAAYETLVVELAKRLYLAAHPGRRRVPKGFATDFHLHIASVDRGSAMVRLGLVAASGFFAPCADGNEYFEKARDLIAECVGAPDGRLPLEFPRELLSHFNSLGRSLGPDEALDLPGGTGEIGTLTPDRRKRLVLAGGTLFEREVELIGTIGEVDWEKSTFRLRHADNTCSVIPMPVGCSETIRRHGGRIRDRVAVRGVGAYDSWDRLQKVVAVETIEAQPNFELAAKFDALGALKDGWLDGAGKAPDGEALAEISERMVATFPESLPLPAIVPTPEGNLLLEWSVAGDPSADLDLVSRRAYFHCFEPDGSDTEKEFDLATEDTWSEFFAYLSRIRERIDA